MTQASRRGFLRDTALIAAGAAGGMAGGFFPIDAPAVEPVKRSVHGEKFKFSLAAYSYRNLLTAKDNPLTLDDFINDCARMNLEGTELTSYYFPDTPTPEYLRRLKHLCFRLGLTVSGTAVRNDFCHPPGPARDQEIAHVKHWVDHAEILGAPVIRIFSGKPQKGQSVEDAHRLAVQGMEECSEYAGQHGVFLALENHGGLTENVDGLLRLVHDVQSPWFGVNLDSGNFHKQDPYGDLAKIAPYALNAQIKVVIKQDKKPAVPSDFGKLASIMRDAGYRGFIVLEYEESDDPREACPRFMDELREAFA